jgi:hypothetical protein
MPESIDPSTPAAPVGRLVVTNRGETSESVTILGPVTDEGQASDIIFVQPGGRPKIPTGWTVDPNSLRGKKHLRVSAI